MAGRASALSRRTLFASAAARGSLDVAWKQMTDAGVKRIQASDIA